MKKFLMQNEKAFSAGLIGFAIGFVFSFGLISLYSNREFVGNFCARTASQAQEYFKNL